MKTMVIIILFMAGLFGFICQASAEITRSCDAYFVVKPTSGQEPHFVFGRFSTVGMCRNRIRANECRERAANRAHQCMRGHWSQAPEEVGKGDAYIVSPPQTCRDVHSNSSTAKNYSIGQFLPTLRASVCEQYRSRETLVTIFAVTGGKEDKCRKNKELTRSHRVFCGRGKWTTVRCAQPADLDRGIGRGGEAPDLIWGSDPKGNNYLRAIGGASMAWLGSGHLEQVNYGQFGEMSWQQGGTHACGRPRTDFGPGLFALKTAAGNHVVVEVMGYKTWSAHPLVCRDIAIRYALYPKRN